jgi:hypothetical protein
MLLRRLLWSMTLKESICDMFVTVCDGVKKTQRIFFDMSVTPENPFRQVEIISVTIIFDPSNDDLMSSWCDHIEVTVEVNDEPS